MKKLVTITVDVVHFMSLGVTAMQLMSECHLRTAMVGQFDLHGIAIRYTGFSSSQKSGLHYNQAEDKYEKVPNGYCRSNNKHHWQEAK